MFSPSVELWKMNDNIFGSVEDLLNFKNDSDSAEVDKATNALWLEDESFISRREIAAYLGKLYVFFTYCKTIQINNNKNRDPFCHRVLKQYMDFFDFTDMKLDEAFR
jgi:hypothetical protein